MASLQDKKIKDTFQGLLKTEDNEALTGASKELTDGEGNGSGLHLNTAGDFKADGTLEFNNLKDTTEDITITKFVDEADGIASNDNDATIPTSAAVKDYVDNNITAQDLDIAGDTGSGAVDLDSESLSIVGIGGIETTVSGQTVTIDPSGIDARLTDNENLIDLQITDLTELTQRVGVNEDDIESEEIARIAGDNTLQANIDSEEAARISADNTLQSNIDAEASTRAAADSAEAATRLANDNTLQDNIDAEEAARISADNTEATARQAADTTLQSNIDTEEADRISADSTLQSNIDSEAANRLANDTTLQSNIDAEETARVAADSNLQSQITSNDGDITALDGRLTTAETNISSNDTDISTLTSDLATETSNRTSADATLQSNIDAEETARTSGDASLQSQIDTNDTDISNLQSNKQNVSEKGQASGYASLDSNGTVPVSELPEAVTGSLSFQGVWDASTNTPTLPDPTTVKGDYYKVSVEGTYLGEVFHIGDWVLSDGVSWEHIHTQETVSDVFGREGSIIANEADYSSFYPLISDLDAEETARISADNTLQSNIDSEATTRANNDLVLQQNIDAEETARIAADSNLQSQVSTNEGDINNLELTKQDNLTAGTGISLNGNTVTNTSPDQVVSLTGGTNVTVAGSYPSFTINATSDAAPVDSVNGQTGVVVLDSDDVAEGSANLYDKTVTITSSGSANVTGTYPNFNVSATDTNTTYSAGTGISISGTTINNTITNNNQLTNGAGYTTNVGDITGVTAGSGISGGGTSGTVTINHADTSAQSSVNNSGATVVQDVTLDTYGHVTGLGSKTITLADLGYTGATNANYITNNNQLTNGAGYTTNVGDITGVTAGTNLTGGGTSGTVTLNLASTIDVTRVDIGNEIQLQESTDRPDLLQITSVTSSWAGIQLRNSSNEGRWSLMTDGSVFGVYDDENSDWSIQADENGEVRLYYNASERFNTHSSGATVHGDLTVSGGDIVLQGTGRIQGIDTVSASTDAANKAYVDNTAAALVTGVTAGSGIDGGGTSGTVTISIEPDLRGNAWLIGRDSNDYFEVGTTVCNWVLDGATDMRLYNNGDLHVEGDVIAYSTSVSDSRLKDNVKTIDNALDKVEQLRGVEYDWNSGSRKGQHEIGVIAQEVEEVFPFLVREKVKSTGEFENNETTYKTVDYEKLVGVLIESVKELSAKVKTLEAKLQ